MSTIHLELLGSTIALHAPAPWTELLAELWAPFVRVAQSPPAMEVVIEGTQELWSFRIDGGPPQPVPNGWELLDQIRHAMTERASELAPSFLVLHAGVVERDGRCVLIAGPSGVGKTTLTMALLGRGWSYMSDDIAPIDIATLEVAPFPKPLGVRSPEGWTEVLEHWSPPEWLREPERTLAAPAHVLGAVSAYPAVARVVVLPDRAGDQGRLTPAEAVVRLGQYAGRMDRSLLPVLASLARAVPAHVIPARGVGEALARIQKVVEDAVTQP